MGIKPNSEEINEGLRSMTGFIWLLAKLLISFLSIISVSTRAEIRFLKRIKILVRPL